ncbi:hypothetical protein LLG95_18925 [bacterium]|nr:hypothetical protein [bacterium]
MHAVPSWELVGSHEAATVKPVAPPVVTEFALTLTNPPRQTEIRHGNPLCLLAARTRAGMGVCNQGCGVCRSEAGMLHTCPFGLEMQCAEVTATGARWVGRRFSSANSMHKTLELLEVNGIDREEILASLPDEPVVPRSKFQTQSPTARSAAAPEPAATNDERAGHLLEYVEQVHRLIAAPGKREEVCNRFLRALCGAVPFDEMAIYLADAEGLVLAAAADRDDKARPRPRAHPCKPPKDGLVAQAAARSCTMIQKASGPAEPFVANDGRPRAVAIPLAGRGLRPIGVWHASCAGALNSPIQLHPMRLMHLLAEMLAERLDREDRSAAPGVEVVAIEDPNHKLMAELRSEVARATRFEGSFALLRVAVDPGRAKVRLPLEVLGEAMAGAVRPYDRVRPVHGEPCAWWVMGAHAGSEDARAIGARLIATLEDVMDAHGGAEELGISFRVGISVWGDDAASADEMVAHATAAVADAMEPISQFRPPCLVSDHG